MNQSLPLPSAIIYDWDNTLIDTFPVLFDATNATRAQFGKPLFSHDEAKRQIRLTAKDSMPSIYGDAWPQAYDFFLNHVRAHHLDNMVFMQGAAELVEQAQVLNIPQGVFSNKTNSILRAEVERFSSKSAFLQIIGSGDFVGAGKPDPAGLLHILGQMGLEKHLFSNIWYVGDTENDLLCARAAGVVPVFIENDAMSDMDEIALLQPQYHFKTCLECLAHLTTLG